MNACPKEQSMLRALSGEMPADQRRQFDAHLATCPVCASVWAELSNAWDSLGNWPTALDDRDLTERVLNGLDGQETPAATYRLWSGPTRLAASVAVAVTLGIAAGRLTPVGHNAPPPVSQEIDDEEVADAIGLTALGIESATGLTLGFDSDEGDALGEGS